MLHTKERFKMIEEKIKRALFWQRFFYAKIIQKMFCYYLLEEQIILDEERNDVSRFGQDGMIGLHKRTKRSKKN